MIRIHIRYVCVLSFGKLGVTESEFNMRQTFSVVGENGTSQLECLSQAHVKESRSILLRYLYSPSGHHSVLVGSSVGVLDSEFLKSIAVRQLR